MKGRYINIYLQILHEFDEFDGFDEFDEFRAECQQVLARVVMRELLLWGGYG